jgi:hypothetical protein
VKKAFRLGGLLQLGYHPEEFEGAENQLIVAVVILADLAQADLLEILGPRDRKCFHCVLAVEVAVVLAPVDFRPRNPVV